ncbi:hypothetical protein QM012_005185 [Aureobasidium pullulans]|uniref:CPAF-like PDZ domain-containing protein n=1 Tax=Aureobasidium pullulans TaxID=5580 RepID=A0ABR0T5R4_AURPU
MMLGYMSFLLPVLAQAAPWGLHSGHSTAHSLPSWPLTHRRDNFSTASPTVVSTSTGTTTPSTPESPCKNVRLAVQNSTRSSGRVPAKLAYDCLISIPFNQSAAVALMKSIRPYLDWQTTTSYLRDPPKEYAEHIQPPYDFWAVFDSIEADVANGAYASEYDFGWDLYQATQQAHDGHFAYTIDVVGKIFSFERSTPLVSVSENGKDLPLVYVYADILAAQAGNSSFQPSHLVQIDGVDTTEFLLDWAQYGTLQDHDALWNDIFYSSAQASLGDSGSGAGTFVGGGRGRFVYPGPTTTLTFANGSNATYDNCARNHVIFRDIDSGADLYREYLTPKPGASLDALEMQHYLAEKRKEDKVDVTPYLHKVSPLSHPYKGKSIDAPGYPTPVIKQRHNMNGGYFLDGPGFEDVAVLTVASFVHEPFASVEFQKINSEFIAAALAANMTKLIIDVSANGGGILLQGYDLFKQLFPSIHPYGASRFRAHEAVDWMGEIYSNFSARLNSTQANSFVLAPWDYRTDLDSDDKHFESWKGDKGKYGPHDYGNDTFTSLLRWNLHDPQINRYSGGIHVTGYGEHTNKSYHQPFETHNIILVYDGYCASTCAIFSEFLRHEAGVKTIALGGRPSLHPMQGVGGVKGANMYPFSHIFSIVQSAISYSNNMSMPNIDNTALARYTPLALARATHASVNSRDGIRKNDTTQKPWQFLYEPTECRIFYTKQMVLDQSAVWKTVADTVWGKGNACVAGNNNFYGDKKGKGGDADIGEGEVENRVWDVRDGFDMEAAWRGLEVKTENQWENHRGDCVMYP